MERSSGLLAEFIIVSDFSLARRLGANRTELRGSRGSISRNEILLPAREREFRGTVGKLCEKVTRKSVWPRFSPRLSLLIARLEFRILQYPSRYALCVLLKHFDNEKLELSAGKCLLNFVPSRGTSGLIRAKGTANFRPVLECFRDTTWHIFLRIQSSKFEEFNVPKFERLNLELN